jgi:hypothetical protein
LRILVATMNDKKEGFYTMAEKYLIYYQAKSGVVKKVPVMASHKEKAREDHLRTNPQAKITHIRLL